MSKLSSKQFKRIANVSFVYEVIKDYMPEFSIDFPPENWMPEEKRIFDMLCSLENKVKQEINNQLGG